MELDAVWREADRTRNLRGLEQTSGSSYVDARLALKHEALEETVLCRNKGTYYFLCAFEQKFHPATNSKAHQKYR